MPGSTSSDSIYLGKFSATGVPAFEKELPFDTGTRFYALAVDAAGAIWLAGAQTPKDGFPNESMVLAKYDSAGNALFFHVFPHDGSTCYVTSISVNAAGDVALTGTFNGTFNLGGDTLKTQATFGASSSLMPNGFAARFTNAGAHVWSQRFGGPIFVRARDLASPAEEILAAARRSTPAPVRHHHALGRSLALGRR